MAAKDEVSYIIRARDGFSALHKKADQTIARSAAVAKKATLAGAAAFGVATVSIAAMVRSTAIAGDEFQKMSARIGISSETLTELKFAAELSGTSIQTIENGIRKMSKTALDAERGLSTAKRSFDELGISVEDSNGNLKDSETLFTETIGALNEVENSTRKTALAQELFGKSGTALIPLIDAGSEGLKEMRQQASDLGITFNQLEADQSAAFVDAELRIRSAAIGMKNSLGKELIPFITEAMDTMSEAFIDFKATGDLDEWAADVAEGVITVFTTVAEVATNVPLIWQASMVSVKTISADAVAILDTVFLGVEKFYDLLGGLPGDIGLPYQQAAGDIRAIRSELSDIGTDLLVSADASSRAGEEWGDWQGKALSAIAAVRLKSKEAPITAAEGPIAAAVDGETPGKMLAIEEAEKIISLQQAKFQRLHEMAIEADLNERELSALKFQRQIEEMEADSLRLQEAGLLNADLKTQFLLAEEEALFLHEKRLTNIEINEQKKRLSAENNMQKLKLQTAVTGFNNILTLTGSHSKSTFKALQVLNAGIALNDSKTAILGAYKHGASIGGPLLGGLYATAAIAATGPLVSAISGMSGGGGGSISSGSIPSISPETQPAGSLIATDTTETARPIQQITLNVQALDPSEINWDNYSESIVDTINRAGAERDVRINLEATRR